MEQTKCPHFGGDCNSSLVPKCLFWRAATCQFKQKPVRVYEIKVGE